MIDIAERPILFSTPMVPELLADTKTQTRRIAKFKFMAGYSPDFSGYSLGTWSTGVPSSGYVLRTRGSGGCWNDRTEPLHSPYGQPGDHLWVRETWAHDGCANKSPSACWYRADKCKRCWPGTKRCEHGPARWTPGIHMFRWASRITLEVTGVRVERLNDISEEDAKAEGLRIDYDEVGALYSGGGLYSEDPRKAYRDLWEAINGRGSWKLNPWVWCLTFKRTQQ